MTDQHQQIALIATAISEAMTNCNAEAPRLEPEQSKQLAKCVVEALADAGLQIMPSQTNKKDAWHSPRPKTSSFVPAFWVGSTATCGRPIEVTVSAR